MNREATWLCSQPARYCWAPNKHTVNICELFCEEISMNWVAKQISTEMFALCSWILYVAENKARVHLFPSPSFLPPTTLMLIAWSTHSGSSTTPPDPLPGWYNDYTTFPAHMNICVTHIQSAEGKVRFYIWIANLVPVFLAGTWHKLHK